MHPAAADRSVPGASPAAGAWLPNLVGDARPFRNGRRWLLVALVVYALALTLFVPQGIGCSWRECDTQTIARNFLHEGFNPLRPQIDWRGDTNGAVECEFPLYQTMVAAIMTVVGEAEWPGRLVSLLAMVMATISLHRLLEARAGAGAALAGALVFLSGGHAALLGSRVMPDGLSTAMALAGLAAFLQFLATGRNRTLVLATVMTIAACLTKPTALQVGLLQFLWAVLLAPRRLRELRVWVAFGVVLAVVGGWLVHGAGLYAETGLTFGVTSGGETKFPTLRGLRTPAIWLDLLKTTVHYGFSALGFVGLAAMLVRRRIDRADLALLGVVGLGLVGTLKYSCNGGAGAHYHIFAAVAGAFCVARAWPHVTTWPKWATWLLWSLLLAAVFTVGGLQVWNERTWRQDCLRSDRITAGAAVAAISRPGELLVVHGGRERVDTFWRGRTNFEDPILLYHARRHGWVLPCDGFLPADLVELRRRGATIVVDQEPGKTPPESLAWLSANADLVKKHSGGQIYRLRSPSVGATTPKGPPALLAVAKMSVAAGETAGEVGAREGASSSGRGIPVDPLGGQESPAAAARRP